jgi:hypothetical protein
MHCNGVTFYFIFSGSSALTEAQGKSLTGSLFMKDKIIKIVM